MSAEAVALTGPPPKQSWTPSSVSMGFFFGMIATFLVWLIAFNPVASMRPDAQSATTMPTTVNVDGVAWDIQQVALGQGLDGLTVCDTRVVYINKDSYDKHVTLMHELSHAIVCGNASDGFSVNNLWYNSTTNKDHEGIYHFSETWAEMLRLNPQLAAYLGGNIN